MGESPILILLLFGGGIYVAKMWWEDYQANTQGDRVMGVVGVTRTEPLRELVWSSRKDPDHERKEIHDRAEDPDIAGGR